MLLAEPSANDMDIEARLQAVEVILGNLLTILAGGEDVGKRIIPMARMFSHVQFAPQTEALALDRAEVSRLIEKRVAYLLRGAIERAILAGRT